MIPLHVVVTEQGNGLVRVQIAAQENPTSTPNEAAMIDQIVQMLEGIIADNAGTGSFKKIQVQQVGDVPPQLLGG